MAVALVAGTVAVLAYFAPRAFDDPAARAVAETWLHPLAVWCGAVAGAGVIAALAAAAILRPVTLLPRLWATAGAASPPAVAATSAVSPPAAAATSPASPPAVAATSAASPPAAAATSPAAASAHAASPASPAAPSPPVPHGATAWLLRTPPWARALVAIALGAALLIEPLFMLELAVTAAGLVLVVAGASELLRLAGDPPTPQLKRIPRAPSASAH